VERKERERKGERKRRGREKGKRRGGEGRELPRAPRMLGPALRVGISYSRRWVHDVTAQHTTVLTGPIPDLERSPSGNSHTRCTWFR